MKTEAVLDASAILALLKNENGAAAVKAVQNCAQISAVNAAEVVSKLIEHGWSPEQAVGTATRLGFEIVDFDADLAMRVGILRGVTRAYGLSLGDRACLALAEREGLPVLTTDRAWATLDLGVEVVLIR